MALDEYVVFAGPDVTPFRFPKADVFVHVADDGELYLREGHKSGPVIAVFAREHWVGIVTREAEDGQPEVDA